MIWTEQYKIGDLILGKGSFGEVKEATNLKTLEKICVKIINKDQENGISKLTKNHIRELKIAEKMLIISHPNLVDILGVYEEQNEAYIFMEQCENNLEYYLQQVKSIDYKDIDQFIIQITRGYLSLKEKNIIHRDLKPANILYQTQNQKYIFKIADFGLSKILDPNNQSMTDGVGTRIYQAPEIETHNYNDLCDIYSFGIIIFELLTKMKTGKKSLFRFKEKKQLQQNSFSQLYEKELQDINVEYKNLLDKMIDKWDALLNWKQENQNSDYQQVNQQGQQQMQQSQQQVQQNTQQGHQQMQQQHMQQKMYQDQQQFKQQMQEGQKKVQFQIQQFPQTVNTFQQTNFFYSSPSVQSNQQFNIQFQSTVQQQNLNKFNSKIDDFPNSQKQQTFLNQRKQSLNLQTFQQQQQQQQQQQTQLQNNQLFTKFSTNNHNQQNSQTTNFQRKSSFPASQQKQFSTFNQQPFVQQQQQQQQQQLQQQNNQCWWNNQLNKKP